MDLDVFRACAGLLEAAPFLRWLSLGESVEEFAGLMRLQLDLRLEANHLDRFSTNFSGSRQVSFPRPVRPLVSDGVLVESFEGGEPIATHLTGEDGVVKRRLARIGVDAFLKMCFLDNFVHGDMHPGNMLVSGGGADDLRLVLLDAGITTELSDRDKENFVLLFSAIVKGDGREAGRLMLDNARDHRCQDPEAFCEGMRGLVDEALGSKLRLESISAGEVLRKAFSLACTHRVKIESNFASICIAIMVLEGVGRRLDPTLDILNAAIPVLAARTLRYKAGLG
uniref:ABC1 atypical kinase-like domain-containing protein n=2 Tax=Hemiselmis andersenii TaxID=464988 RepID=A0A7S1GYA7_HEMAN